MFRNQYDNDASTWSPQGRIHQIEYAMEAVKQGSAVVGLRSDDFAVLVAVKRSPGELASYQKKIFRTDDHMGIAIAGLTSDARVLSNFMRNEAMRSRTLYDRPLPVFRIANTLSEKAQTNTQEYGRRPYGVGLLIIGYDETGPHLYEFSPSANVLEYFAMSIGSRSQSARTYLERRFDTFPQASLDDLIEHGLRALRDTLAQDKSLDTLNCSIAYVGKDTDFTLLDGEAVAPYLARLESDGGDGTGAASLGSDSVAPMETEA
ncbi:Proteasome subunit alpha type-6 [Tieghemiomyces parasiticus]|uniref:Proteasome subunit alpha type n=1 Tax=Tieghemiomyces parasiticus TaxID=78921 RepID=A0A9W8AFA1_9FUNG|nr:Proteasome subunit alpha type-6 [Tieghemiomyces parasiticus]